MEDRESWRRFLETQERVKAMTPEQLRQRLAELDATSPADRTPEQRREFERLVRLGQEALLFARPDDAPQ